MNKRPDYVPSPEHLEQKLRKFKAWQADLAGLSTPGVSIGPIGPRPNNDRRDFVPAEPLKGDKFAAARGSLRGQAEALKARRQEILNAPTQRRVRWEEAKAKAAEMLKDGDLLKRLTRDQVNDIRTAAEAVYPPELVARDEADKKLRIARLTQPVG